MPHSILMMHHPSGASRGQASEMHIESRELVRMRDYLSLLVSDHTGQPYDRVRGPARGGWGRGVGAATGRAQRLQRRRGNIAPWIAADPPSPHTTQPHPTPNLNLKLLPPPPAPAPPAPAHPIPPPPHPNPTPPQVIRELSRNKWMNPKEAIEYGMIDKVLTTPMPKMPGLNKPNVKFSRSDNDAEQDIGV
jgi:hypothetical protein